MRKTILFSVSALALAIPVSANAFQPGDVRPGDGSNTLACEQASGTGRGSGFVSTISPGALRAMDPRVIEALRQKDEASRASAQVTCNQIKADAAAKQKQYDEDMARYAEAARRQATQLAEKMAQQAAQAKEEARIAALPINRLLTGYRLYNYVSICNQVREGYLVKYVNDIELERARQVVKGIADKATQDDPSINTDDVWAKAQKNPIAPQVNENICHTSLVQLINSSPKPVFSVAKP
jgi:hypothetical protein